MPGPLAALALAACQIGPGLGRYPFVQRPEGVDVGASVGGRSYAGELLAVQDEELLLLIARPAGTGKRIVSIPFGAIEAAEFGKLGRKYALRDGRPPAPETRERLRLVSRFPAGLSEELLGRLLQAYGQVEVERIGE